MKTYEIIESAVADNRDILDVIGEHLAGAGKIAGVTNSFVHFTKVEKLGIRPETIYSFTPKGIYSFPSDYVIDAYGSLFGGSAKFVYLFRMSGNVVNLDEMGWEEVRKYVSLVEGLSFIKSGMVKEGKRFADGCALKRIPGKWFYEFIKGVAAKVPVGAVLKEFFQIDAAGRSNDERRRTVIWNYIFRAIGIDGLINYGGEGLITDDIRVQCVTFSKRSLYDIELHRNIRAGDNVGNKLAKIDNERYYSSLGERQAEANVIAKLPQPQRDMEIDKHNARFWENLDIGEEFQFDIFAMRPAALKYFKVLHPKMRMYCAKNELIGYVPNPTEVEQVEAIMSDIGNISLIKNLTKGAIRFAIALRSDKAVAGELYEIYKRWPRYNIDDILKIPEKYWSTSMEAAVNDWKKRKELK